jgi:hypothetical protein
MNQVAHTDNHTAGKTASGGVQRPVISILHRDIYLIAIGLASWLVLSVWLFSGTGITNYLLFIVSGFILIVVALVSILSRVGRRAAAAQAEQPTLREWTHSDFEIGQGGDRSLLSGTQAAILILLPLAAVAFGMTLFGVALLVVEHVNA